MGAVCALTSSTKKIPLADLERWRQAGYSAVDKLVDKLKAQIEDRDVEDMSNLLKKEVIKSAAIKKQITLDMIVVEDSLEALALRSVLECWQVRVNLHLIATADDLVNLLNKKQEQCISSSIIVLSCHGDKTGLCMPQLTPELIAEQPYKGNISAKQFSEFLFLPDCFVINTGCLLGDASFAKAFLNAGCKTYIGAHGYPEGNATMFYLVNFFYEFICHGKSILHAHTVASKHDTDTQIFKLYQRQF